MLPADPEKYSWVQDADRQTDTHHNLAVLPADPEGSEFLPVQHVERDGLGHYGSFASVSDHRLRVVMCADHDLCETNESITNYVTYD